MARQMVDEIERDRSVCPAVPPVLVSEILHRPDMDKMRETYGPVSAVRAR